MEKTFSKQIIEKETHITVFEGQTGLKTCGALLNLDNPAEATLANMLA